MLVTDTDFHRAAVDRENDLQVAERLTVLVVNLANGIGSDAERRGRDRLGRFVAKSNAIKAQVELEAALLTVATRIARTEANR